MALNLFIADTGNNRIMRRLALDLSYVSKIGTLGSGNDQFNLPAGICVDSAGLYLYVADTGNNRIVKRLVSDLSYVSQIGSLGSGNDQFDAPKGICIDSTDTYLYVADYNNIRIVQRAAIDLSYVDQTATNSGNKPIDIAYDMIDDALVVTTDDFVTLQALEKYLTDPLAFDFDGNPFQAPQGCWVDGNLGRVYYAQTGLEVTYNLRKTDSSFTEIAAFSTFNGGDSFESFSVDEGPLDVTSDGTYLYVLHSDSGNFISRVLKFLESDFSYISEIGTTGTGNDQFNAPRGIYVVDIAASVSLSNTFAHIVW
jgi:DNA-binding beta-propeller fold protein YncE